MKWLPTCLLSLALSAAAQAEPVIYVLDPALRLLPYGVAGEVFIGGGGLARGFLCRLGAILGKHEPGNAETRDREQRGGAC